MSSLNSAPVKEEVGWTEKHVSGQHGEKDERHRAVKRKRNAVRIKTEKDYELITVKKEENVKEENEEFKVNAEDCSVKKEKDKFDDVTVKEERTHFRVKEEEDNAQVDEEFVMVKKQIESEDLTILSSRKKRSAKEALARQPDESWTTSVPADSDSDDEDLLLREDKSDSDNINEDYRIQSPTVASKGDDYSGDESSTSAAPQPQLDRSTEAQPEHLPPQPQRPLPPAETPLPQPGRSARRHRSAPLPQPRFSSDTDSPEERPEPERKRKASSKSAHPRKRGGGRPQRVREEEEEEEMWHNREEQDERPDPIRFLPIRPPGPTINRTASWSPLQLFQLFFSTSVLRTIIANTNRNAAKRLRSGLKFTWVPLTMKELYIFLAIVLYSGLVSVHEWGTYWRKNHPYNFRFPADSMTRNRFEAIMWSLHLSNPDEDEDNNSKKGTAGYDRLFKIKPLYTEMTNACKSHFQPYKNIAIDERMVGSKARITTKQYMKAKPIKWGYKLIVLADSQTGYTWNFFVYEGKSVFTPGKELSYTSVMDLMPFPLLGRGYTLFVDNFYSSPALFEELHRRNTGACGTVRTNRIGFVDNKRNNLPKNAEQGDLRWMRKDILLFIKWMDTREVTMCSSVHAAFSGKTVNRKVKKGGVWQTKTVPIPDAVADYNQNMGGVALSDALIGYYSVHHKTTKWYKTFFFHFIDIAVVNSFLLHKELHKNNPTMSYTQKKFREKLLVEMLNFAKDPEPNTSPQPAPKSCMPEYIGNDATKDRKHCKRCLNAGNSKVKTPVHCRKCRVPLCLTSQRNCFRDWHDSM
ncbi:hypothetical protein UPYG_G00053750 [Umbra pygmaea]|uniref:PiggyBac transposable element-derived protein domain-containing protein n=1 Tax=Umbra pygmaea TaxID=75934 RepID=A0ABD0X8G7_UMBPY